MRPSYYNEFDVYPAQWLRNLMAAGHIKHGHVDTRSIVDVRSDDLRAYDRCHFFAGISGWSRALRLARVPDDFPVWTGSCPCQPFSNAGKRKAHADARDLWPEFRRLIAERRPPVVFGEQVASSLGREWLAGVRADLEALGYAVGAADLCSPGAGAPHIRQRLWWGATTRRLADPGGSRHDGREDAGTDRSGSRTRRAPDDGREARLQQFERSGTAGGLADTHSGRQPEQSKLDGRTIRGLEASRRSDIGRCGVFDGMGNACSSGLQERVGDRRVQREAVDPHQGQAAVSGGDTSFWSRYDVVHCTDGKARRFEPGSFPLAHGVPGRVGRLRAYGNSIVSPLAAVFIREFLDLIE